MSAEHSSGTEFLQLVLHELDIKPHGRNHKKIAFGWYGGKYSHLSWLLPLLPATNHYCEPFGGSAAVLLNRAPSPVETYNDLDSEALWINYEHPMPYWHRPVRKRTGCKTPGPVNGAA